MSDEIFYSFRGKILKRDDKDFIIVIWPDIPFYLALPKEYQNFIEKIIFTKFEYKNIQDFLIDERNMKIFNYLIENKIVSKVPHQIGKPFYDNIRQLYYISLQVAKQCNLRCKHCYASAGEANENELSTDQLIELIEKASSFSETKECNFIITGGEPFTRKDILSIINFAMSRFKNVVVITNGLLLSENLIKELSKIENLTLQVSLDGAKRETHEYLRGEGTYDKLLWNIERLISNNIKVAWSPICTENFFDEIDEYFELAKKLKVHTVQLQPVQYIGRALTDKSIRRVNSKKIISKIVEYYFDEDYNSLIKNGLESKSIIHVRNLNRLHSCGTGHGTMYIKSNGDIFSCPNMAHDKYIIGNALKDDIKDLYYNSPIYKELRSFDVNKDFGESCMNCEVKHFCGGGCRGVCLANRDNLYGKAIECNSLKMYFTEIIWEVCEHREFFKEEAERWLKSKRNLVKGGEYDRQ